MSVYNNKVLICLGPGGVGKTTTSVALALKASLLGKKCLVMTIDPSRRLASVLDLDKKSNKDKLILKQGNGGELWGKIIDPEIALKDFVKKNSLDPKQIDKLFANKLFKQLTSNLKDSQDFTSIESLALAIDNPHYDMIILDTPPIQNLFDFFNAPENMYNLFNSKFLNIISSSSDSKSLIKKFIGTGAKGVLALLAKVTGKTFVEELLTFFKCLESLTVEIRDHSKKINEILSNDKTAYVLITEPRDIKLKEAEEIISQLKEKKYPLKSLVFNRAYPAWLNKTKGLKASIMEKNTDIYETELKYYQKLNENLDTFCKQNAEIGKVTKMPIFTNISDIDDIKLMTDQL